MTSSSTPSPLVTSWVLVVPHPSPALNQVYSVAVAVVEAAAVAAAAAVSVWASVAVVVAVAAVAAAVVVALGATEDRASAVVKLPQRASECCPIWR